MAAFARIRLSTSTLVRTMSRPVSVSLAHATTYSGPWSPVRTRGVRADTGSAPTSKLPLLSITPVMNNSATSEISPDPQMPFGLVSPMTRYVGSKVWLLIHTSSIAPRVARIPHTTPAPSNAGPAEHAHVTNQSRVPSTISPFVPTSMNSVSPSASARPQASTPPVMSAPTYEATPGRQSTAASG